MRSLCEYPAQFRMFPHFGSIENIGNFAIHFNEFQFHLAFINIYASAYLFNG